MVPFASIFTAFSMTDVLDRILLRRSLPINPVDTSDKPPRYLPVGVGRASYFLPSDQGISEVGYSKRFIQSIDDEQTPAAQVLFRNEFDVYRGSVGDTVLPYSRVPLKL